jgi:hypothetical protein
VIGRLRFGAAVLLSAVAAGLMAAPPARGPVPAHAFAISRCLATGAGLPATAARAPAWAERDPAARAAACHEAERAHRERARWEAEHQVARERARAIELGARFRAERARAGFEVAAPPANALPASSSLPPCPGPDATGECTATAEQILYQIEKSRAAGDVAPAAAPAR